MSELETIAVKRKGGRGWHLINKIAFDPKVHEVYTPPKAEKPDDKGKDAK